jgi:hypothetical protein
MPAQSWLPVTNSKTYTLNNGSLSPSITNVDVTINDYAMYLNYVYSDYRLQKVSNYINYVTNWMNIAAFPDFTVPYTHGMAYSYTPVFQNQSFLVNGNYTFRTNYIIQGLNNNTGEWEDVETYYFDIILNVTNVASNPTPTFAPSTLRFNHQQNQTLPSNLVVMNGNNWKIIGKPNFVLTSPTVGVTIASTGSGTSAYQTISGSGSAFIYVALGSFYDSESVFVPADLTGDFEIQNSNVYFGQVNWTVAVVRLSDFLTVPYLSGEKAFTLDQKYFEFSSQNLGTYFQFDSEIKTYDFFNNTENVFTVPQKIVLFQGKSKVNLGQLIHRLMRKFPIVNESTFQNQLATLNISCKEILAADETVVRAGTKSNIKFVAGLSRGITDLGFLDFNPLPNRGTKNGFAMLNILYPTGNYEFRILKNGTLVSAQALPASNNIIVFKKVSFAAFNQGDIIQCVVDFVGQNNSSAPKKTFKLFPVGNYSNTIVWENEFLLQSVLECTGTASIKSDFEFLSQKVYQNLVEVIEHFSSSKEVKLFINTGWLLKTDVDTIESLMRSKRVWLLNNTGNIALRPVAKPIINEDLERELIEFSLEFIINRNYDEETYSL